MAGLFVGALKELALGLGNTLRFALLKLLQRPLHIHACLVSL